MKIIVVMGCMVLAVTMIFLTDQIVCADLVIDDSIETVEAYVTPGDAHTNILGLPVLGEFEGNMNGTSIISETFLSDPGDGVAYFSPPIGPNSRLNTFSNAFGIVAANVVVEEGWLDSDQFRLYEAGTKFRANITNDGTEAVDLNLHFFVTPGVLQLADAEGVGVGHPFTSRAAFDLQVDSMLLPGNQMRMGASLKQTELPSQSGRFMGHELELYANSTDPTVDFTDWLDPEYTNVNNPSEDDITVPAHNVRYDFTDFETDLFLGTLGGGESMWYEYEINVEASLLSQGLGAMAVFGDPFNLDVELDDVADLRTGLRGVLTGATQQGPDPGTGTEPVPEPASMIMLGLGSLSMMYWRRRHT